MGSEEEVLQVLTRLGYTAEPTDPQKQEEWRQKEAESLYLLLTGMCILLCALALAGKNAHMEALQHRAEWIQMKYMGFTARQLRRILFLRRVLYTAGAMLAGCLIAMGISPFVDAEFRESSIFSSPPWVWTYCILLGIYAAHCLVLQRKKILVKAEG